MRPNSKTCCRGHTKGIPLVDINHGVPSTYGLYTDDQMYPLNREKNKNNKAYYRMMSSSETTATHSTKPPSYLLLRRDDLGAVRYSENNASELTATQRGRRANGVGALKPEALPLFNSSSGWSVSCNKHMRYAL